MSLAISYLKDPAVDGSAQSTISQVGILQDPTMTASHNATQIEHGAPERMLDAYLQSTP